MLWLVYFLVSVEAVICHSVCGQEGPTLQREYLLFYLSLEWKQMVSCDVHLTFSIFF